MSESLIETQLHEVKKQSNERQPLEVYEAEYWRQRIELIISKMSAVEGLSEVFPGWENDLRDNPKESSDLALSFLFSLGMDEVEAMQIVELEEAITDVLQRHFDHYTGTQPANEYDREQYQLALQRLREGLVTDSRTTK